jgi:hypothetical protein
MNLLDPAVLSSPAAWADFAPCLHVCDRGFAALPARRVISDGAAREAAARLGREGYFQLPPMAWDLPIEAMAEIVQRLADLDIPPVFAWHYDEFWLAFARCYPILVELLDDHPVMLPEFWAWHIDPLRQDAGWAPHRDKGRESLRDDGRPKIATLWLPLTDATTLNGCMYIVPADRDPTYGTPQEGEHRFSLADIRALPAEAGSVLGWDQAVLHWGSHAAARDDAPRISIACEFQRRDVPPFNAPLLDPLVPPDFATRQVLIGRQMLRYQHMVHAGAEWQSRAEQMASAGRASHKDQWVSA